MLERLDYNTKFLEKQPGLVQNTHFERKDDEGNLIIVTVAVWKDHDSIENAKTAIQEDYARQKFNLLEKLKEWGVVMERGLYQIREK